MIGYICICFLASFNVNVSNDSLILFYHLRFLCTSILGASFYMDTKLKAQKPRLQQEWLLPPQETQRGKQHYFFQCLFSVLSLFLSFGLVWTKNLGAGIADAVARRTEEKRARENDIVPAITDLAQKKNRKRKEKEGERATITDLAPKAE